MSSSRKEIVFLRIRLKESSCASTDPNRMSPSRPNYRKTASALLLGHSPRGQRRYLAPHCTGAFEREVFCTFVVSLSRPFPALCREAWHERFSGKLKLALLS